MSPLNSNMNIVHRALENFVANTLGCIVAPDGTSAIEVLSGIAETVFHNTVEYSTNLVGRDYSAHQEHQFYSELENWSKEGLPSEDRKEAMNRIKDAYVNQQKELDLRFCQLTSLPDSVGNLTNLQSLDLGDNELESLPDCIGNLTNLQSLHLINNKLESLPDSIGNLTNLQSLYLYSNKLGRLPDSIENLTNLQILHLINNKLESLPDCIGNLTNLQRLYLYNNKLESLPDCIGNLTNLQSLSLANNELERLPDSIGNLTNLQTLHLQNNKLERLPDSIGNLTNLKGLHLANNALEALPDCIGNLTNLQDLSLRYNRLETLPASIGNANRLRRLDLFGNPLRALPTNVLDLPPTCSIDLGGSRFSDQVLHRLQEITSAAEYNGPQISFSMGNGALDEELPSLDELFKRYFDLAGDSSEKFEFVENLSEPQKVQLQSWLSRLSTIGNLRRAGESEKEFAQKVLSFVNQANQDEKFREVFLGILNGASDTCGDRVALSLLHIGMAYQQATMDLSDPKKVADFLKRGPGALDILEKIARDKVLTLPMVDEIEVYLAYPVQLRETLNLPIDVDKMLYFACSSVTAQDLEGAKQEVQSFLDDEEASLKFLIKQNIWVETLQKAYPERYEEINNQRYDMLEDPATCNQAMDYYEQELIKLSREVLELDKK